jgi:hypothetical protein
MNRLLRLIVVLLFTLGPSSLLLSQTDSIARRIILIGDAGKQEAGKHPELELVRKLFPLDARTTVIFLGDNIYPQGLPSQYARNYQEKKQIIDSQINLVRGTAATSYFIPGNHDWMQGRSGGWQQVINQWRYIESLQLNNVKFAPSGVCPGPDEIRISDDITLVVIDSQWWLHRFEKPSVRSGCDVQSEAELLEALKEIIQRNEDKLLLFAAHHPFITFGRHGGYYNLKQHIFPFTDLNPKLYIPLPVIGSIYPIARGVFGNIQDTKHPIYKNFSKDVDSLLSQHPYCIRVAGHEHNLQLIQRASQYYIVSGAGSKTSELTKDHDLLFGAVKTGFAVIEHIKSGGMQVRFFSSANDTAESPLFSYRLPALDSTRPKRKTMAVPNFPDSVTVAGAPYYKAGRFKKWLLGKNYRDEWTTPVRVQVFDISKEKGGLKPLKRGGGMQTKSLRLEDAKGNEFVLRSIEKFPDATLPEEFRQTIVKDAVVDGISASYPYAALSIPPLSAAAQVPHPLPKLVYVPDDPRLGYYQQDFANTLCIFEEREPGGLGNNVSTEKVLDKLKEDNDDRIDQQAVLKARLLDMFIMDFDRHEDQWRWATEDTGKGKIYLPIPRDRDQAFFVNFGKIPKYISKPWILPKFQGFRAKAKNINTFNFNARFFDRTFLNRLPKEEWLRQADTLISQMTDEVIEEAIEQQPPEVFQFSGPTIIQTLKERRTHLKQEAEEYYKFLSKEVNITGSDKAEFFKVLRNDDGSLDVQVYKISKDREVENLMYERRFNFLETREIRLYGFSGKDSFEITGSPNRTIIVRIIGGPEQDYIRNESEVPPSKTFVYDFEPDSNVIVGVGREKKRLSDDPAINDFNRREFKYDLFIPKLAFAYNRDDGLFLGAAIKYVGHGFRKEPYHYIHEFRAAHALLTNAYLFQYNFEMTGLIGSADLLVQARLRAPNNTINFFGIGNNTRSDLKNGKNIRYYRTRFLHGDISVLLRRELAPDIHFLYGPVFEYYAVDSTQNRDRIIDFPSTVGLDSSVLYKDKSFAGARTALVIDNRNDVNYPTRGVRWVTSIQYNHGIGKFSRNVTQMSSDLSVYISSNLPARTVIAVRVGGGVNFGTYEFYQAQFLSGTENLRGFRRFRFAGDKMFFNNVEARIKLKDFKAYLFPGTLGLLVFHDVGRVWAKGESSTRWHHGYGAGLWLAPARRFVVAASYTRSREGALPLVSLGFQF